MALTQGLDRGDFIIWDDDTQAVIIHSYGKRISIIQEKDMVELTHKQMEEIIKLYKLIKKNAKGIK